MARTKTKPKTIDTPSLQNPHQLDREFLKTLTRELGRLAELDEKVAADAVRFVADGAPEEVLLTIGGLKEAADALCLTNSSQNWQQFSNAMKERTKLFWPKSRIAAQVWIRLGRVFEAASPGKHQAATLPAGWPAWLAHLLVQMSFVWHNNYAYGVENRGTWPMSEFLAILEKAELPADLLLQITLNREAAVSFFQLTGYYYGYGSNFFTDAFTDWNPYLMQHLETVRNVLNRPEADNRIHVLQTLGRVGFDFSPVLDLLAQMGTSSSKTVREEVLPILHQFKESARAHVEKILAGGDASARNEAALLLWRLLGVEAAETLRQRAEQESAARVKQTIEKLLAAPSADSGEQIDFQLPPVEIELGEAPLPETVKQTIRDMFARAQEQAQREYEAVLAQWNAPDRPKWMQKPAKPKPFEEVEFEHLFHFVEGTGPFPNSSQEALRIYGWRQGTLGECLVPPEVKLIQVVRLANAFNHLQVNRHDNYHSGIWWHNRQDLEAYRSRCQPPFGLRELDAVLAMLPEGKPGLAGMAYLSQNSRYSSFCDWEPEYIWPLFAEQPEILKNVFNPPPKKANYYDYGASDRRRAAFRVLGMFPKLPGEYIPMLWDIALGDSKTDRPLAQQALATVPDKTEKILVALKDGKQTTRAAAVEWLGKVGDRAAIEPLKEAFRKEKQEAVKGTIMAALDALGADVNEFLNRDQLLAEAKEGLQKKRPRGMEWVPLDRLPALHWQDTGQAVDPAIVQWWVVQSIQQKSPVCGPLLRRYLQMCRPVETAALARFILTTWIGHDTRSMTHEEATEKAKTDSDKQWAQWSNNKWWADMYQGKKENLFRQLYQNYINQCLGSAIEQKGMLAIVSAAGDQDCVKLCEQYLRKWFGHRLAQCKCLIEVLAWITHPLAIQVLLSIANRFRTKALRQAATDYVNALAEREGWTLDELADRTIPDGGFARPVDENDEPLPGDAVLVLDYGQRKFTVKLNDNLQPMVTREDGKTVKEPPLPAKDDDEEKAKEAKKAFSEAKKTVKEVVKRQSERLYEALCTQRAWRCDDWSRYLAGHPIVGKLCCRLVWAAFMPAAPLTPDPSPPKAGERGENAPPKAGERGENAPLSPGGRGVGGEGESFLGCFRPLEDGSLSNEKDEEVNLPPETLVRLAHTCNVPDGLETAWLQHLQDYDVTPLFQQFGRPTYQLPEEKKKETDIKDFVGHQITTFKLRGKATKLGYLRGQAEDGGCFYLYHKPFPSLGLQASIEFTGSCLPEEDRPAALKELYFTALRNDQQSGYSWYQEKMALSKIPPVLLSECYNDLKQIAAEGTGYDAEWEKKSYW